MGAPITIDRDFVGINGSDINIDAMTNLLLENQNGQNHTDSDSDDYLSIIYMASGNSGDTVISDGENDIERVSFKEGRLVIFKSNIWHRGEAPTCGHRVTLGAVYPLFKV